MKARFLDFQDFEVAGEYKGKGGFAIGEGEFEFGANLTGMSVSFERVPDISTMNKAGQNVNATSGGLKGLIMGSGAVKAPPPCPLITPLCPPPTSPPPDHEPNSLNPADLGDAMANPCTD